MTREWIYTVTYAQRVIGGFYCDVTVLVRAPSREDAVIMVKKSDTAFDRAIEIELAKWDVPIFLHRGADYRRGFIK